jgi:hypothetical protein
LHLRWRRVIDEPEKRLNELFWTLDLGHVSCFDDEHELRAFQGATQLSRCGWVAAQQSVLLTPQQQRWHLRTRIRLLVTEYSFTHTLELRR